MVDRPKISDLIVHDPDDGQQLSRDALELIGFVALANGGLPSEETSVYEKLVGRYEAMYGCIGMWSKERP